jgi:hypothetical protein
MDVEILYHYCPLDAFLSIIENKTLRLSDTKKSNDSLEGKALLAYMEENVLEEYDKKFSYLDEFPFVSGMKSKDAIKLMISARMQHLLRNDDILCYASCLSEEGDLLSQWRAYADNGRGVSIGFDFQILQNLIASEQTDNLLKLNKVEYVSTENAPVLLLRAANVQAFLDNVLCAVGEGKTADIFMNPYNTDLLSQMNEEILLLNSMPYKHDSFIAEKEWRIVLDDELRKSSEEWDMWYKNLEKAKIGLRFPYGIKFRSVGNDIVSYIDMSFQDYLPHIIKKIIIGPNCSLSINDLNQLLRHFDVLADDLEIEDIAVKSNSPYVGQKGE